MKTVLTFLFLLVIGGNGIAQSKENYRSRNHKLNRNYLKSIKTKQHEGIEYKSRKSNPDHSQPKVRHRALKPNQSNKMDMKLDNRKSRQMKRSDYQHQNSTFKGSNKKNGKKMINYITMVLAFSLFLVN